MSRTIIVGDVHGCADELDALLDAVAFQTSDTLVFVGDLVVRGPDPRRVIATARELGALSVRGNHEHRLLHRLTTGDEQIDHATASTGTALDEADWAYLRAMPLWIDLPQHDLRVVHAGVMPDVPITRQRETHLLHLRALDEHGGAVMRRDTGVLWGERYQGPPHVVFGHHALAAPQLHRWATGIDTGCVYGGALTALVLDADEPVPAERRPHLVAVPARRTYASR